MLKNKCWRKGKDKYSDGRTIWHTKDHHYGLVVNQLIGKDKYHVGYNSISRKSHTFLGHKVSKKKAFTLARRFMREHNKC